MYNLFGDQMIVDTINYYLLNYFISIGYKNHKHSKQKIIKHIIWQCSDGICNNQTMYSTGTYFFYNKDKITNINSSIVMETFYIWNH